MHLKYLGVFHGNHIVLFNNLIAFTTLSQDFIALERNGTFSLNLFLFAIKTPLKYPWLSWSQLGTLEAYFNSLELDHQVSRRINAKNL